jgi:hypothetical protein
VETVKDLATQTLQVLEVNDVLKAKTLIAQLLQVVQNFQLSTTNSATQEDSPLPMTSYKPPLPTDKLSPSSKWLTDSGNCQVCKGMVVGCTLAKDVKEVYCSPSSMACFPWYNNSCATDSFFSALFGLYCNLNEKGKV